MNKIAARPCRTLLALAAFLAAGLFPATSLWAAEVDLGQKIPTRTTASTPYTGTDYLILSHGTAVQKIIATILNPFTGDSGAGGISGLVPAPSAGDAAAGKFLSAFGDFRIPPGGGTGCTVPGTANRILYDTGTACGDLGASTDGQLIVGQTGALPLWKTLSGDATLSAGGALTIANLAITTAKINTAAVTYAKLQTGASNGLLGVNSGGAPTEVAVGSGCTLSAGTLNCPGTGSATGAGVQGGQSPSNIGNNTTALPSGHYYYATNVAMTAQRTHALPDSVAQGVGDLEIFDAQQTATETNQLCVQGAGTDKVNKVTNGTACISAPGGSLYLHNDGAGEYSTGAAANIPAPGNAQLIVGKTGSPSNSLAAVTLSQDCTITNAGVITCTKTNNVAFTALATTTPGIGVATAAAANLSANGGLTKTVFSGAKALATGAISSAACTSAQTDTATGTLTTDVVLASFSGDPTAVTGYVPLTAGMLTIMAYPTADTVNFKVCNNTSGSITPGAITLNWRVVR